MTFTSGTWRRGLATLGCGLALACGPAHAVLGGDERSIEGDRARLQGERRVVQAAPARVRTHEITMADGSSIREFVNPNGVVFAVSWSTRLKPRLDELLGAHALSYADAARHALVTPGIRHNVAIDQGDLVVQASAHLNSHVGMAYVRSLVPEGVRIDALH